MVSERTSLRAASTACIFLAELALAGVAGPCLLLGCAAPGLERVVVSNEVDVSIVPAIHDLSFDPRSARLAQATRQLTGAAGHPVSVQIDAALVPPLRSSFEEALARAIEETARGLSRLRTSLPAAFTHEAPLVRRVDFRYAITAERPHGTLDAAAGTVVVSQDASSGSLAGDCVASALADDYDAWLQRTMAVLAPESVPREKWAEYFAWASSGQSPLASGSPERHTEQEKFDHDPRGESLVRMARFAKGVDDPGLLARVDEHLVHELYYLLLAYQHDATLVRRAPPGSTFRRAEAAWVDWAKGRWPSLGDKLKVTLVERLFDRCGDSCLPFGERYPGLDPFALGLGVADAWLRAGHPANGPDDDARFELMDVVVCPVFVGPDGRHTRNRGCGGGWVQAALADEGLTRRLAAALGARDEVLVQTLFANFRYGRATPVVALWRALAPYPKAWNAAAVVVIEELLDDSGKTGELVAESERLWAASPERRGAALYLMARADRSLDPYYADQRWSHFGERFGGAVGASLFGAMLDISPRAFEVARVVWPALGRGWARGDVLVRRLDGFLDEPRVQRGEDGEPSKTVRAILKRMCDDRAASDVARIHDALARRVAAAKARGAGGDPAASTLETLVADSARAGCVK